MRRSEGAVGAAGLVLVGTAVAAVGVLGSALSSERRSHALRLTPTNEGQRGRRQSRDIVLEQAQAGSAGPRS